jgi:hypothetical protein
MKPITSYEQLDKLGRVRLSPNFYMRDFLFSEIAAWHACQPNDLGDVPLLDVPQYPDRAIKAGKQLCVQLFEPFQATFGRIVIRSGYRSPTVNAFGNAKGLNCGSNESNYGAHIWDYPDAMRKEPGAMACILVSWFEDHRKDSSRWAEIAWRIHDHLTNSTLQFFASGAFNIGWHNTPQRVITSTKAPHKLTSPDMANHSGSHPSEYPHFPKLKLTSAT